MNQNITDNRLWKKLFDFLPFIFAKWKHKTCTPVYVSEWIKIQFEIERLGCGEQMEWTDWMKFQCGIIVGSHVFLQWKSDFVYWKPTVPEEILEKICVDKFSNWNCRINVSAISVVNQVDVSPPNPKDFRISQIKRNVPKDTVNFHSISLSHPTMR